MKELNDFSDVLANDIVVEEGTALEFEFDNFILRRERNHWEIQFEDAEGEQGITIEREDFSDGKFEFDIDGKLENLLLEDFDRIEKFAYEKGLLSDDKGIVAFGMTAEDIKNTVDAILEEDSKYLAEDPGDL
jgi:hypothetical protein